MVGARAFALAPAFETLNPLGLKTQMRANKQPSLERIAKASHGASEAESEMYSVEQSPASVCDAYRMV